MYLYTNEDTNTCAIERAHRSVHAVLQAGMRAYYNMYLPICRDVYVYDLVSVHITIGMYLYVWMYMYVNWYAGISHYVCT